MPRGSEGPGEGRSVGDRRRGAGGERLHCLRAQCLHDGQLAKGAGKEGAVLGKKFGAW